MKRIALCILFLIIIIYSEKALGEPFSPAYDRDPDTRSHQSVYLDSRPDGLVYPPFSPDAASMSLRAGGTEGEDDGGSGNKIYSPVGDGRLILIGLVFVYGIFKFRKHPVFRKMCKI